MVGRFKKHVVEFKFQDAGAGSLGGPTEGHKFDAGSTETASDLDQELVRNLRHGVDAMINGLPAYCHHSATGARTNISDVMEQADFAPQVVENMKTHKRHIVVSEEMFAWLVQSVSDPVTAVMDQIAARGRSVPLPESRSKSRPLRQIEFPLAKPLAHHEK